MTPERWSRIGEIYHALCDLAPAERQTALAEACWSDPDLRHEVESLLAEDDSRAGLLDGVGVSPQIPAAEGGPGSQLGPYRIEALIGRGGMGEVYRARDHRLGRQVAIKVLPGHLAAEASARERLRREAAAAAALDHPFICKVFEIGEDRRELYLVMEFIDGETLHKLLRSGRMAIAEALRFAVEIAEALEKAHNERFVHRDLKPANVMIAQGHVKIMDFGLAKQIDAVSPIGERTTTVTTERPVLTHQGSAIGTPEYMSPEQIRGEPLDRRSDLFSFGIVLCELFGAPHPFRHASPSETMAAILRDRPRLAGDLPENLALLIRRLLAKSPEDRYRSISETLSDLRGLTPGDLAPEKREGPREERMPLIGRDTEKTALLRHLDDALAGHGSMILIGGEAGIGKTHLVNAILKEARRRGAYTNVGHCYEMEGAPPYVPFIEMLEYTARVAPKEGLRLALGDAAPEIAKLMPELRRMFPDIPPAIGLPAEQQRRFLFNAYREFLERGSRVTPIVHVFEDLHWADEPTLLLLQHLAPMLSGIPLLAIGTYRDVEVDGGRPFAKALETLLRKRQALRMTLRRLAVSGVEGMLTAMSGQQPPPSLTRLLFAETEGNPFFVEEVFRHLGEEGKLFDEEGKWRTGLRADRLQVPEGVRLVLGRRLDRLRESSRRVLTTAAVVGRSFSLRLIEELENGQPSAQPDAALDAIEEAENAFLVSAEPAGRELRYRFVHELVRQTMAETLSPPRRQRLHARVAEAIEKVYAANLEAQASPLAHHLYQAGAAADPEKTRTWLIMAAHAARAGAAHEEALTHLENALALCEDERSIRVAELTEQKAAALQSLGRREEALEAFRQAIAMFEDAGLAERAAGTGIALATDYRWHVEFRAAHLAIDRALDALGSANPRLETSLLTVRAGVMATEGDASGAAALLAEVAARRNVAGGGALNAVEEISEMWCLACSLQFDAMSKLARRIAEKQRAAGDLWGAADAERHLVYQLYSGRTTEAVAWLSGALSLAERVGHYGAACAVMHSRALLSMARGDLAAAKRELEDARSFGSTHDVPLRFINSASLGELAFLRGNLAEAEVLLSERTEAEERTFLAGWRDACLFAFRGESESGMNSAGGDRAIANLQTSRAWKAWTDRRWKLPAAGKANPQGAWFGLERSVIGLAWLGRRKEVADLRPLTEESILTGVWVGGGLSPLRTAAGIAAACDGDWSAAEQHHIAAIRQTDTAPYRVSQPIAREWYAIALLERASPGDASRARGLLGEALAMYESMGMPFHARRASESLAKL
jgi:serine/threonine protein kinase/tetratricopeptide (TPR) repeat protein